MTCMCALLPCYEIEMSRYEQIYSSDPIPWTVTDGQSLTIVFTCKWPRNATILHKFFSCHGHLFLLFPFSIHLYDHCMWRLRMLCIQFISPFVTPISTYVQMTNFLRLVSHTFVPQMLIYICNSQSQYIHHYAAKLQL